MQFDFEFLPTFTSRIIAANNPLKIVLFGSRARGNAQPDIDYVLPVNANKTHVNNFRKI